MELELLKKTWPEWEIDEKKLGKGSYGVVYKAIRRDHGVESYAAIKVISVPGDASEIDSLRSDGLDENATKTYLQGIVDDFVREIQLMESLKGVQNIVSVEDYQVIERQNEIGWTIFIRMELLTSLNAYVSEHNITENEVIQLGMDICSALEICGKRNIIHRDIKPENIFVNDFGHFKLGDFGIARKLENVTSGMSQKGTWNYVAPEVANGKIYDASVDTYSLGIVLYRLLNRNKLPFWDLNKQMITPDERGIALARRLSGEALNPPCEASEGMSNIILRACADNPNQRFSSATEMKEALQSLKAGTYRLTQLDYSEKTTVLQNDFQETPPQIPPYHTFGKKKKSKIPVIITILAMTVALTIGGKMLLEQISNNLDDSGHIHDYGEWVITKHASEHVKGEKIRTCEDCGEVETEQIPLLNHTHSYVLTTQAATCTATGWNKQTCACGDVITETLDMIEHDYVNNKCSICGTEKTHQHVIVTDAAISPTCTNDGITAGSHCEICNAILIAQQTIPATGHEFVNQICINCGKADKMSEGLTFVLNNDKKSYTVSDIGVCTDTEIIIPEEHGGLPVTAIGHNAFKGKDSITSIVIPNSVTSIGNFAFSNCQYMSSLVLGNRVETIGQGAFYNCKSLTMVTIPSSVKTITGRGYNQGAFENCTKLTKVVIGDSKEQVNLTTIGAGAFINCTALQTVEIGNGVETIENNVFYGCTALEQVTLGSNIKTIDYNAFTNCTNLKSIVIPNSVTSIGNFAFSNCQYMSSLVLGNRVETIGQGAFYNCKSLTMVTIPSSVKTITGRGYNQGAFENCTKLTKVIIGDSEEQVNLTTIGAGAFINCTALQTVQIGKGVGFIENNVFQNCESLRFVDYLGSTDDWGKITLGDYWCKDSACMNIKCSNGNISIK